MVGTVRNPPFTSELNWVIPYKSLAEKFRQQPYTELLANQGLLEEFFSQEQQYLGPTMDSLDPKVRIAMDSLYKSIVEDLETKWLHFQSLLWYIEQTDEDTDKFLRTLAAKP